MAIYHLTAKVISRGKGQSAIAAAAYRSGERLRDEQADEQKFYKAGAERIMFTDIMAPKDAPEWAHDRNQLWNNAERAEKRKDAQLAREIEVSLPHELTEQQREWLAKDFAREAFVRKGYAVDIAIHAPDKTSDDRNHHAHLMVTMRTLGPEGFAATKDRSLNSKEQMGAWREQWAHLANRHLERHGHEARIDHRSLAARGIDQEPTIHLGYAANEIAQRGGQSDRMDQLRGVLERNEIRLDMKALDRELKELTRQVEKAAPIDKGLRVIDSTTGAVSKLGDFLIDLLAGASPARDAETDMGAFVSDPAARKAQQLARLEARQQERQAQAALERMEDDMKAGKALAASDIQALTRAQQETIRAFGDDAVRQMVEDAQRRAERYWKGEERERDR
jgi:ATP-dependent exoDNAse (exonuclease V) alpha subunit